MKYFLCIFLLQFSLNSYSQDLNIVIELNNGTTKEGQISGWGGYLWGYKEITIHSGKQKTKVSTKDIQSFTIYEPEQIRNFKKIKAYKNAKNEKLDNNDLFAEILYNGKNITLYYGIYGMDAGWSDLRFYCLRKNEEFASVVSLIFGKSKNQVFKNEGAEYFSDYKELADKIKSKHYTYIDIIEVVRQYDLWKSSQ